MNEPLENLHQELKQKCLAEEWHGTISVCQEILRINPNDYETWRYSGVALSNLGRYEEALDCCQRSININGDYYLAWYDKGLALCELNRYPEAFDSFEQAIRINPNGDEDRLWYQYEVWYSRGLALYNLNRYPEAVNSFTQAVAIKPDYYQVWYYIGITFYNLEQYQKAIEGFEQVLKLNPEVDDGWYQYQALYRQGLALYNLNRYPEAIDSLDQSLKLNPDNDQVWQNRAITLNKLGRYEEALASYDQALAINPDDYLVWNSRGDILSNHLQRYEEAIDSFDQSLKLNPDNYLVWNSRGVILSNHLQRYEEAIDSFDQSLKLNRDNYEVWNGRGAILSNHLQRYEEAIDSFDQALAINPKYDQALNNKGITLRKLYLFTEAIKCSEEAIEINPNNDAAWCNLIFLIFERKGYQQAKDSFNQALKYIKEENDPQGWANVMSTMGKIHYQQGVNSLWTEYTKAQKYYEKARRCYETVLEKLEKIEDYLEKYLENYLKVLSDLIIVLRELEEPEKADSLTRQGSDILRSFLDSSQHTDWQKRQLALRFASFNQLSVDLLVKDNKLTEALETAEQDKNACLSWFFDSDYQTLENINSPSFGDFQRLLSPNTAMVYWHHSPVALTCFILNDGDSEPNVISINHQRLQEVVRWCHQWRNDYQQYGQTKSHLRQDHSWRTTMTQRLNHLKAILNIDAVCQHLKKDTQQLILIPHRDLHLFPLHALFPDSLMTCYLPSVKAGQFPLTQAFQVSHDFLSLEGKAADLWLVPLETQKLSQLYDKPKQIKLNRDTFSLESLQTELEQAQGTLNFSGHGNHDFSRPSQSALIFEQVIDENNNRKEEYKLTAYDIYHNLSPWLKQYSLATFSACEIGSTNPETITTEYVGISSVLLSRGLKTVISPLWRVEDDFTSLMMIELHRRLREEKETPNIALILIKVKTRLQQLTFKELIQYLDGLHTQVQSFQEKASNQEEQAQWRTLQRKLGERLHELEQKPSSGNPFNHPYYLEAFICQGLSF